MVDAAGPADEGHVCRGTPRTPFLGVEWPTTNRKHHKQRAEGRSERLNVFRQWFPDTDGIYANAAYLYMRKNNALDDIIDAMVTAVASVVGTGQLIDVPEPPEVDPTGLPMKMAIPSVV